MSENATPREAVIPKNKGKEGVKILISLSTPLGFNWDHLNSDQPQLVYLISLIHRNLRPNSVCLSLFLKAGGENWVALGHNHTKLRLWLGVN